MFSRLPPQMLGKACSTSCSRSLPWQCKPSSLCSRPEWSKGQIRYSVWSLQPVWFPAALKKSKGANERERDGESSPPRFHTHIPVKSSFLSWPLWGAFCHASSPCAENQSLFSCGVLLVCVSSGPSSFPKKLRSIGISLGLSSLAMHGGTCLWPRFDLQAFKLRGAPDFLNLTKGVLNSTRPCVVVFYCLMWFINTSRVVSLGKCFIMPVWVLWSLTAVSKNFQDVLFCIFYQKTGITDPVFMTSKKDPAVYTVATCTGTQLSPCRNTKGYMQHIAVAAADLAIERQSNTRTSERAVLCQTMVTVEGKPIGWRTYEIKSSPLP